MIRRLALALLIGLAPLVAPGCSGDGVASKISDLPTLSPEQTAALAKADQDLRDEEQGTKITTGKAKPRASR